MDKQKSSTSSRKYINAMRKISFEAKPLYYRGEGEVGVSEVDKALRLLLELIKTYEKEKPNFGFKMLDSNQSS